MKKIYILLIAICLGGIVNGQIISTVAGGGSGDNGLATHAQLWPNYTLVNGNGDVFIVDYCNNSIRKVNANTNYITTIAGNGFRGYNGDSIIATKACLFWPVGIALDTNDNLLYISENLGHRIRKVNLNTGIITTIAGNGTSGYNGDSLLAINAQINYPNAIALDNNGNIYFVDAGNNRIRKILKNTGIIYTVAGNGVSGYSGDGGNAIFAKINSPKGLTIDLQGNIYISDTYNHRIRKVFANSNQIISIIGNGNPGFSGDGALATIAKINQPKGIAVDEFQNIYFVDHNNNRIRKVSSTNNYITTIAGSGNQSYNGDNINALSANLFLPLHVSVDKFGNLYIADDLHNRVRKVSINNGLINTFAGNGSIGFAGENTIAKNAKLYEPIEIVIDSSKNIYICDRLNNRIRKVSYSTGLISTIIGNDTLGFNGDGMVANKTHIYLPIGIVIDKMGNIIFSDSQNHRIRKINTNSGIISTIAGNGIQGYNGDEIIATSAQLNAPWGLAIDDTNNIYITDYGNSRVRKISSNNGLISTVAGNGISGFSGDNNLAINANIKYPRGIALDNFGNIFFIDSYNNRIRKISVNTGIITTIVGTDSVSYNGEGILATNANTFFPQSICIDTLNNIYFTELNNRIRVITANSGLIYTLAGNGNIGYPDDNINAINAIVNKPTAVKKDNAGDIYFSDGFFDVNYQNYRIRKFSTKLIIITSQPTNKNVCLNNLNCDFNIAAFSLTTTANISYQWQIDTGSGFNNIINSNNYSGVTSSNLHVSNISNQMNLYKYRCVLLSDNASIISDTAKLFFNILPSNAGMITGLSSVYKGQTNVTYVTPIINNATSYVWSLPMGATGSSTTNSITVNYSCNSIAGNISVYGVNSCGNGLPSILNISVGSIPQAGIISGPTSVCKGQNDVVYTVPSIPYSTSYIWSLPNGVSGMSNTNTITVSYGVNSVSGVITVKGANSCEMGTASSLAINVTPLPNPAGTISGLSTVCQGQNSEIYVVNSIPNASSYVWTLPSGSTGTSTTNTITVNYGLTAVSGNIKVYGVNSCGIGNSSLLAITVNPLPNDAGVINGYNSVCQGQNNVIYSVPSIVNANSYVWTLPTGATGSSITNTITINYGNSSVSSNITVKGKNICGNGLASTLPITVNPLPFQAGAISGIDSVCINQSSVSYSISAINNAASYNWTLPPGATGNSTTNSINVDYGNNATSGNISVYGINSCGNGLASVFPITVADLTPNAADTISGNTAVMAGQQNVIYSIPSIPNTTNYTWDLPTGVLLNTYSGNAISVNFSQAAVSGNISVYGSNICGDGVASSLYVTVNPLNPNCSAQFNLVADTTTPHNYFAVNNASGIPPLQYNWSWGDGSFSTTAYPTHTYNAAGNYKICLTIIDSVGCTTTYCDSSYLQKDPNAIISVQVIPQGSSGINSLLSDKIKIYPNPAKENLIIELSESKDLQNNTISIYNIQGQLCRQIISNQSKTEIDIKDLSTGLYFVKLNNEKESFVSRFVKE